jgi:protein-L-isoaspartate O-methyltransferase
MACPRSSFLERFFVPGLDQPLLVDPRGGGEHWEWIGRDVALALSIDDFHGVVWSAQSQPSLVMQILQATDPHPGQSVLEVGSGSGWLAAMIATLVGPTGSVLAIEVLQDLALLSKRAIKRCGINNVDVVAGDAMSLAGQGQSFDVMVCSASLEYLPNWALRSLRQGGRLLVPLPVPGGGDTVVLFEKTATHFRSIRAFDAAFVPAHGTSPNRLPYLIDMEEWTALKTRTLRHEPLWEEIGPEGFLVWSFGLRGHLSSIRTDFIALNISTNGGALHDRTLAFGHVSERSLCLISRAGVYSTGDSSMRSRLERDVLNWIALGRPSRAKSSASFGIPKGIRFEAQNVKWQLDSASLRTD